MEQRMRIVTIGVFDLDRSWEFYELGLGLTISVAEGADALKYAVLRQRYLTEITFFNLVNYLS